MSESKIIDIFVDLDRAILCVWKTFKNDDEKLN